MLIAIIFYQIAADMVCLFFFIRALFKSFNETNDGQLFLAALLILFVLFHLYTNIYLLFKKRYFNQFLKFNTWVNFLQIFQITLFGITYNLIIGTEIAPYFLYDQSIQLGLKYDFFNIRFTLFFSNNLEEIRLAINIVPLVIFIILFQMLHRNTTKLETNTTV